MNLTTTEILEMIIAIGFGLVLLAVGSIMAMKGKEAKDDEIEEAEAIDEKTEETKKRIEFLKRYAIQIESMHNYEDFKDYDKEIEWINKNLDELDKENSSPGRVLERMIDEDNSIFKS